MDVVIQILGEQDQAMLEQVAPDLFDQKIEPALVAEFLRDPRHHMAVALAEKTVVGFASAVHYIHPDKPPELWLNEIAVAPAHRRRGLARRLIGALLAHGHGLGCQNAWVLTESTNRPAVALYRAAGARPAPKPQALFTFSLDQRHEP